MNNNLALDLTSTARAYGQRPALRLGEDVLSYAELDDAAARVAGLLRERRRAAGRSGRGDASERSVVRVRVLRRVARRGRGGADERAAQAARGRVSTWATREARLVFAWHEFAEAARSAGRMRRGRSA